MILPKIRIAANVIEYPYIAQAASLSINFVCQLGISVYSYKEDQLFQSLAN